MSKIIESQINPADAKAIFAAAAQSRSKSGFMGMFKKQAISVGDLQAAWKEEGYPDDLRDIQSILKNAGFGNSEIQKVFAGVLGKSDSGSYNEPTASPTIQKIADYAKKSGIDKELIAFMRKEFNFNESYAYEGKVVIEDVRQIFTAIVQEERKALPEMIKAAERTQLGRNKK